jgi:hypothetical protein
MTISQKVLEILRTRQRQQAGELLGRLGVSRPSLMRAMTELDGQVVSRGRARRTAYAARRSIRGNLKPFPFYRVEEQGQVHESGILELTYLAGCAVTFAEDFPWPLGDEMRDGWFRGLSYPFGDMRPQG